MRAASAKKSVGIGLVCAFLLMPGNASADYPPVPKELGRRVETPVLVPSAIASTAAVAVKVGAIGVVVEPKPNLRTLTIRAVNTRTGRVTTRTVLISNWVETVSSQLILPKGLYKVQVIGKLKNGRQVRWNAGTQRVRAGR